MHFSVIATALLAASPTALGHGWIFDPPTVYANGAAWNNMWGSTLRDDALGPKNFYNVTGALKYIDVNLPKQYKSVKDLLQAKQDLVPGADPQCGWTRLDEAKRTTLPPKIKFTPFIHPGPCEFYCDNTLVQSDRDCMSKWPDGIIPIDVNKCVGANRFSMYWLTVHTPPWQVYSYCVYLKGANSAGPKPGSPQTNPQPAYPQPAPQPQPANPQPAPQPNPQPAPPKTKCEYKKRV